MSIIGSNQIANSLVAVFGRRGTFGRRDLIRADTKSRSYLYAKKLTA